MKHKKRVCAESPSDYSNHKQNDTVKRKYLQA